MRFAFSRAVVGVHARDGRRTTVSRVSRKRRGGGGGSGGRDGGGKRREREKEMLESKTEELNFYRARGAHTAPMPVTPP